jgi:hypothetical protein
VVGSNRALDSHSEARSVGLTGTTGDSNTNGNSGVAVRGTVAGSLEAGAGAGSGAGTGSGAGAGSGAGTGSGAGAGSGAVFSQPGPRTSGGFSGNAASEAVGEPAGGWLRHHHPVAAVVAKANTTNPIHSAPDCRRRCPSVTPAGSA